ncbi:MAG: hypothetical protein EOO17_00835 [Chloroflexi bacterium]|nr:MAG: hypothetical protein EOO17_00835 [Chloroflexota bacterium]
MADNQSEQKQRTNQQNRSLHLFYTHLAKSLNESGYDMKRTLSQSIDIPWTPETVKQFLWKPIQNAQLGKESTTELTTKEIDEVYDTLTRHLGDKLGVSAPLFPSIEDLIIKKK